MIQKISFILFLGLALLAQPMWGQSPILAQYIEQGLEENLALKRQDLSYRQSEQALRAAKGLFYPQVQLIANYTLAGGGRTLDFPVGDLLNPVYATLNQLTETQQFPTNIENVNEQFLPNNFQETKVRVIQPLFNPDIYFNQQIEKAQLSMSAAQREAYRRSLIRDLQTAYFGYLQSEEVLRIYEETGGLLRQLLRTNQSLVANDKATPEVVSQAELQISQWQSDRAGAEQQRHTAQAYFNFLLNRPLEEDILVDSSLQAGLNPLSLEAWQGRGQAGRIELEQVKYAQEATLGAVSLQRWRSLPTLSLVVDAGFQGFGYEFSEQEFILGQVALTWNLFSGFQRQAQLEQVRLQSQSLNLQEQELQQQINFQVQQAYDQVQQAQAQLSAAEQGLKHAQLSYRLLERKYQESQANWLELTQARTDFTPAQIRRAIARYALMTSQAELSFAVGDF